MLSQLLESGPRRRRRHFSAVVSIVGHAIALGAAVAAARPLVEADDPETVITWHPPAPPPTPPCVECAPPGRTGGAGERITSVAPIPDRPPAEIYVDVPAALDAPDDRVAIAGEEWRPGPVGERSGALETGVAHAVVDREVVALPTNPVPRFPAELRAARIEGKVLARFVVDTSGRVIMETVIIDASPHAAFSEAVVAALRRSRFRPAEARGRKVRQLVSQPFLFVLRD